MKYCTKNVLAVLVLSASVVAPSSSSQAQGKIVSVGTPIVQSQKTPDYNVQGPSKKRWTQKEWVEIEVPFTVNKLPDKAVALDALTFRYYVVVNSPDKKKLLTTTVTHTNVPGKENVASVVYISPQTMQKLANRPKVSSPDKLVVGYGVEVEYDGKIVGFFDSTGKKSPEQAFWKDGTFDSAEGLLTKKDTPFAPLWSDYHVEAK